MNKSEFILELADLLDKYGCTEIGAYEDRYGSTIDFWFGNRDSVEIDPSLSNPAQLRVLAQRTMQPKLQG